MSLASFIANPVISSGTTETVNPTTGQVTFGGFVTTATPTGNQTTFITEPPAPAAAVPSHLAAAAAAAAAPKPVPFLELAASDVDTFSSQQGNFALLNFISAPKVFQYWYYADKQNNAIYKSGFVFANFAIYRNVGQKASPPGDIKTLQTALAQRQFLGTLNSDGSLTYAGKTIRWDSATS